MKIEVCPVCESPIEYIELTTLPPVPVKQCPSCGWRWEGKPEKTEYVPVEEKATIEWKKPSSFSTSAYQVYLKKLTEQKEVFKLTAQLRRMSVETGSLLCLGCGYEHNCGIHGCALLRQAVETIERQAAAIEDLSGHECSGLVEE